MAKKWSEKRPPQGKYWHPGRGKVGHALTPRPGQVYTTANESALETAIGIRALDAGESVTLTELAARIGEFHPDEVIRPEWKEQP